MVGTCLWGPSKPREFHMSSRDGRLYHVGMLDFTLCPFWVGGRRATPCLAKAE